MTSGDDEKLTFEELARFVDGELDRAGVQRVVDRMANDPEAARQVLHQQQLQQAVGRVMSAQSPPAPAALHASIDKIAGDSSSAITAPATSETPTVAAEPYAGPPVVGSIGRWVPAAVAAVLLVSSLVVFYESGRRGNGAQSDLLPASESLFASRHVQCSTGAEMLMGADEFPTELEELPAKLASYLGDNPTPSLDLSRLGYEFHAAGRCTVPGYGAVHLIYHARAQSGRHDSLSLWINRYKGRPEIEPGRIYRATKDSAVHPILLWRDSSMIYHLVGDSPKHTEQAANALRGDG